MARLIFYFLYIKTFIQVEIGPLISSFECHNISTSAFKKTSMAGGMVKIFAMINFHNETLRALFFSTLYHAVMNVLSFAEHVPQKIKFQVILKVLLEFILWSRFIFDINM